MRCCVDSTNLVNLSKQTNKKKNSHLAILIGKQKLCYCLLTWCIYPATLNLSDGPDHVYLQYSCTFEINMSHSSGGVLSKKKQIPVCSNFIGDRRWSAGARNGDKGIKFNYIVIYWDVIIMVLCTGIIQIPWMLPVFRLPWTLLAAKVYSCFKNWGNSRS